MLSALALLPLLLSVDDEAPRRQWWRVECRIDELSDIRTCELKNEDVLHPFWMIVSGPKAELTVMPGIHDYPGKLITVRVDQNKAITYDYRLVKDIPKQVALVEQLRRGEVARFEFFRWPSGAERGAIDLAGFKAAHDELIRELKLKGATSWAQPIEPRPADDLLERAAQARWKRRAESDPGDGGDTQEKKADPDAPKKPLKAAP